MPFNHPFFWEFATGSKAFTTSIQQKTCVEHCIPSFIGYVQWMANLYSLITSYIPSSLLQLAQMKRSPEKKKLTLYKVGPVTNSFINGVINHHKWPKKTGVCRWNGVFFPTKNWPHVSPTRRCFAPGISTVMWPHSPWPQPPGQWGSCSGRSS